MQKTVVLGMGDAIAGETGILESTVQRLAKELDIALQEQPTGNYHKKRLSGENRELSLDYGHDSDDYESVTVTRGSASASLSYLEGAYQFVVKNQGKLLLEAARKTASNEAERRMDISIILLSTIRTKPEEVHEPVVEITQSELGTVDARTLLKYLGNS